MKKLLLIEDNSDISFIVEQVFTDINYEVIKSTGTLPIPAIQDIDPNIILLDYALDNGNGGDFCIELKQNPETCYIPVVLFSAALNLALVAEKCYADSYIEKPFDIDDLTALVNQFARK